MAGAKADLPTLRQTVSAWRVGNDGCLTRTAAAIEQAELDRFPHSPSRPAEAAMNTTAPSSPPPAAEAPSARKPGPAKGWKKAKAAVGAAGEAAGRGAKSDADGRAAKMISVRLTRPQLAAVERWRSRFDSLDQGAALRALIGLGLAQRPHEAIDPLGIEKATHRRVRQPRKAKGST
jgi:hypothetical protein